MQSRKTIYNILVLFHHCDANNGGVRSMIDLIDSMRQRQCLHIVAAFPKKSGTAQDYLRDLNVEVVYIPYIRWDFDEKLGFWGKVKECYKLNIVHNYLLAFRVKSLISRVDLIYTNTFTEYFGCILKRMHKIPHIWHIREFGWEDHRLRVIFGERMFQRWLTKYSDEIIVISENLKKRYMQRTDQDKLHVIYDDVSNVYCQDKPESAYQEEYLNILMAGTLQEGKGQLEALEALTILKSEQRKVVLYIAGDDPFNYRGILERYVAEHDLGTAVKFLGQIQDMNSLRSRMHVAVVCSRSEAFGRVTIEAMLSKLAVVGANTAGTAELIDDKRTGLLYEAGNSQELARKIAELYEDRKELYRLAVGGQEYACARFTRGYGAESVEQIIFHTLQKYEAKEG